MTHSITNVSGQITAATIYLRICSVSTWFRVFVATVRITRTSQFNKSLGNDTSKYGGGPFKATIGIGFVMKLS